MRENENLNKPRLDFAYGNPAFLQEFYQNDGLTCVRYRPRTHMPYKLGKSILPELERQIKATHKKYKNAKIGKKAHVVVTVGAVQALQAAMYYYYKVKNAEHLYVPVPYWGRFDALAFQQKLKLVTMWQQDESLSVSEQAKLVREDHREDWYSVVSLITSPNNPDGADTSKVKADIRDACYNWPQYTKKVKAFDDEVVIFSLSKMSGHSSTRIGWAITHNEEAALAMREYVELFTSGVSIESQIHAAKILERMNTVAGTSMINHVKNLISDRHMALSDLVEKYKLPIEIISKEGMFWYISCRPQMIFDLKIKCFEGSGFGDGELDEERNHRYRLNLGVSYENFTELVARLDYLGKLYKE